MKTLSLEERTAVQDGFRRLLANFCSEQQVRKAMAGETGYDPLLWRKIAEMGLLGLIIDPDYEGGIGAGPVELELIMEEAGAALLPAPFFSSAVLAAGLLSFCSDSEAKARLLPAIAAGERIATVALTGDSGRWTADSVGVAARAARAAGDGWRLDGVASYVTAGTQADTLLVFAKTGQGLAAFEIAPAAPGVGRQPQQTLDSTLRLARFTFDNAAARLIEGTGVDVFDRTLELARVALAGEQAGGARRIFDISMDYIKTRIQFGRPVGGFQALKHIAADLLLDVESAISAARHAAQELAGGAPTAPASIALAAFAAADGFSHAAAASIQLHGGIGFTMENCAHLYLRRARADAQLLGNSHDYRERYLSLLQQAQERAA